MGSHTPEGSDDVSALSNARMCAGVCEKTFAHIVGLLKYISSNVCGVCIELCRLNVTNAPPILTLVVSVEASNLHTNPSLPASKGVLSFWGLVVVCALFTREITREKFR